MNLTKKPTRRICCVTIWLAVLLTFCSANVSAYVVDVCSTGKQCLFLPFVSYSNPIVIVQTVNTRTRSPDLQVWGTLRITTTQPVYNVTLEALAYNSSGKLLGTGIGTTFLTATLHGQLAPFGISLFDVPYDQVSSSEVKVKNFELSSASAFIRPTITFTPSLSQGGTLGEVRNTSPFTITNIQVLVWSLNSACFILPMPIDASRMLRPSQAITFTRTNCPNDDPLSQPTLGVSAQSIVVP